jgi:hypothetical protein
MTPMACQHCHRPLNTIGDPAAPAYIHPLHVGDPGHRPVPVPADRLDTLDRRCDFCGDPHPVWALDAGPVTTILVGQAGGLMHDFGDQWAACTSCEMLAATGDINQLVDRAAAALDLRRDPAGRHRIAQLHAAFIHTRNPGRTLITTTGWPPTGHTARDLPRIRDRLTNLYRGGDRLPAQLDHPPLRAAIADGLDRAKLYWIDPEFTDLAGHAAAQLPDTVAGPDDPPAADGLIAWARPVWGGMVAAATWTTKPGRQLVIVAYRSIGGGLAGTPLQRLREQVGWLAPLRPLTTSPRQALPAGGQAVVLVATWLLIGQQVTETIPIELDRALRRAYARQRRPAPEVRIVRLKPRPTRATAGGAAGRAAERGGRGPLREREWVGEHWKHQPYGPGRAQRRLIYIAPYLRGPDDQPIRASTTVRVLGTTHTQPSKKEEPRHVP